MWLVRYRALAFCRDSLWFFPVVGIFAAIAAARILHGIEDSADWRTAHEAGSVSTVLVALSSAVFTLIVFVASALLITMQLASAQLTPRVIGFLFRDRMMRVALTVCVFAFTFTLSTLLVITDKSAHGVTARISAWLCVASLAIFLVLVDHVGRALRPSGTLMRVARAAHGVIEHVYPHPFSADADRTSHQESHSDQAPRTVTSLQDGVVQAFDAAGLVSLAQQTDVVVELIPQVGDFVSMGSPLLRIHGPGPAGEQALRRCIALGQERTLEQDPAFAFRIIVDVACKALSPAVNDPTTAVTAIDCLEKLLCDLAARRLDQGRAHDRSGKLRLMYVTPRWPDFVRLSITEIRHFGDESIQIARRLHALIDRVIETAPKERIEPLLGELKRLDRSTSRSFEEPEDRALAAVSDQQGVSGAAEPQAPNAVAPPDRRT